MQFAVLGDVRLLAAGEDQAEAFHLGHPLRAVVDLVDPVVPPLQQDDFDDVVLLALDLAPECVEELEQAVVDAILVVENAVAALLHVAEPLVVAVVAVASFVAKVLVA